MNPLDVLVSSKFMAKQDSDQRSFGEAVAERPRSSRIRDLGVARDPVNNPFGDSRLSQRFMEQPEANFSNMPFATRIREDDGEFIVEWTFPDHAQRWEQEARFRDRESALEVMNRVQREFGARGARPVNFDMEFKTLDNGLIDPVTGEEWFDITMKALPQTTPRRGK